MGVDDGVYVFGRFRLECARRTLVADDAPVALSSRGFDILRLLVERRDRVVSKDEIMELVWAGTIVEENNLAVQISALRKTLGEGADGQPFIVTVPGRGYRFVGQLILPPTAEVEPEPPPAPASAREPGPLPAAGLPPPAPAKPRWSRTAIAGAAVLAVAVLASAAYFTVPGLRDVQRTGARRLSIAVLPFRNLSDDPQEDYLADAVSDDLTTDLSHLPGSFVIARQSSDAYKGRAVPADQIGRELGVRYLLEGSVRRVEDDIRINAQLIDAATGAHLWADRFDTSRGQLLAAQTAIVGRIGGALDVTLVAIEGERSLTDRPNDPDALDLFLRGRSILDRDTTLDGIDKAEALFERAIALQPDFAEAITDLATLLLTKARDYDDPTTSQDVETARKLIAHALELAPQNPRALAARGFLLLIDQNYQEAMASYRLALALEPSSIPARLGLARCANALGHPEETVAVIKDVLAMDPLDPQNRVRFQQLGMALLMLGRSGEAVEWLEKASAGNPDPMEYDEMAMIAAYRLTGREADAATKYAAYAARWPHRTAWRLACFATKAEANLPGFKAMSAALVAAGMPAHADETVDDHIAPAAEPRESGDFDPTPGTVPGVRTVTTPDLAALLKSDPAAVVVDVGCGAAVVPGAPWLSWVEADTLLSEDGRAQLEKDLDSRTGGDRTRTVVAVGSGTYGWDSYNAALALTTLGYSHVVWYRGGEEAWAAAGMPAEDHRNP